MIPEGTIIKDPSGVNDSLLKNDLKVSSWKRRTTFPSNRLSGGVGIFDLLTLHNVFLLLTLINRRFLWERQIDIETFYIKNNHQ